MKKVNLKGKSLAIVIFCLVMLQCVSVHSSGDDSDLGVADLKDLTGFNSIGLNIAGTLYIEQDSTYSVRIEGKDEDVKNIITKLEENTLIIKTKPGIHIMGEISIFVSMPEVKGLNVSGSGDILAQKRINATDIKLNVSGSGNLFVDDLQSTEIESSISGSGEIKVKGTAVESLKIDIAGSGDFSSEELASKDVQVNIAGSGSARVFASDNLNTSIAGSGDVYYKGSPLVNASSVGSGTTKSIN